MAKIILLSFLTLWAIIGAGFFIFMVGKIVKKKPQKIAFYFISGPLVWIFTPIILLMDFISEKVFEPVYKWLTNE